LILYLVQTVPANVLGVDVVTLNLDILTADVSPKFFSGSDSFYFFIFLICLNMRRWNIKKILIQVKKVQYGEKFAVFFELTKSRKSSLSFCYQESNKVVDVLARKSAELQNTFVDYYIATIAA